jgi:hypothetical protein
MGHQVGKSDLAALIEREGSRLLPAFKPSKVSHPVREIRIQSLARKTIIRRLPLQASSSSEAFVPTMTRSVDSHNAHGLLMLKSGGGPSHRVV